jgi:uncharacterized protein (TIGR02271 family)
MLEGSSYSGNIDWNDVIKKEARGINNEDLGEVQEVTLDYVVVEKGVINKEKFYIPRDLAVGYNGAILIFNISADEVSKKYLSDVPPVFSTPQFMEKNAPITNDLTIIPVMAERLDITKNASSQEAKIIKESITEIRTVEIPLTHDELYIETRAVNENSRKQADQSSSSPEIPAEEEIANLFLRAEVPEVLRNYHLKEELVVKKKTLTEARKVVEQLNSEKVDVVGLTHDQEQIHNE